jgi:hypothetical protein
MSIKLIAKRIEFQNIARENGYSKEEVLEMSLVELRDIVDSIYPLRIVSVSVSAAGGKVKRVSVIKKI